MQRSVDHTQSKTVQPIQTSRLTSAECYQLLVRPRFNPTPATKCAASKLYEAYRHFCQAIGRKPQSTNAFKKALDKLTGVYQSRTSSGMQWSGIQPVMQF